MKERLEDWKETLSVKWFMLDAQQKQAVIICLIGLYNLILEIAGEIAKARVCRGQAPDL